MSKTKFKDVPSFTRMVDLFPFLSKYLDRIILLEHIPSLYAYIAWTKLLEDDKMKDCIKIENDKFEFINMDFTKTWLNIIERCNEFREASCAMSIAFTGIKPTIDYIPSVLGRYNADDYNIHNIYHLLATTYTYLQYHKKVHSPYHDRKFQELLKIYPEFEEYRRRVFSVGRLTKMLKHISFYELLHNDVYKKYNIEECRDGLSSVWQLLANDPDVPSTAVCVYYYAYKDIDISKVDTSTTNKIIMDAVISLCEFVDDLKSTQ
jgi:hypothetical protein